MRGPRRTFVRWKYFPGQVAQLVERSPEKAGVGGSIPSLATISIRSTGIKTQQFESVSSVRTCLGKSKSRSAGLQLFTNDPSQRVFEPRSLTLKVFPQRRVDERLISGPTA